MSKGPPTHALRQLRALLAGGTTAGLTDAQLLQRYNDRRGDATKAVAEAEMAFTALVDRHGPMVWGACLRSLGDTHEAEDAFQATFVILARRAGSVRVDDSLGRWLYGVARRVATRARADRLRRRAKEEQAGVRKPGHHDPEAGRAELLAAVDEEVGRLPERYQAPVVLCIVEGLTYAGAAERLGWPTGTVKGRLAKARHLLRVRLTRRGLAPASAPVVGSLLAPETQAAVPTALVELTVRSISVLARSADALVATPVLTLVNGVIRTMMVLRLARTIGLLTMASVGIGLVASHNPAPEAVPAVAGSQKPAPQRPDARADELGDLASAITVPLPKVEELHRLLRRAAEEATAVAKAQPQATSFTLTTLATSQAKAGDTAGARKTFRTAIREASGAFGGKPTAMSLWRVAHSQIEAGLPEEASPTLQRALEAIPKFTGDFSNDHWVVATLGGIVEDQVRLGRHAEARRTADRLRSFAGEIVRKSRVSNVEDVLAPKVAAAMAAVGNFEAAFERADAVQHTNRFFAEVALSATKHLDRKTARRFVEEAAARMGAIEPAKTLDHDPGYLAEALARIGDITAAKRSARSMTRIPGRPQFDLTAGRVQAMCGIAQVQRESADLSGARKTLLEAHQMILDQPYRGGREASLKGIVSIQLYVGDIEGALQTAGSIPGNERFQALALIARSQALAGQSVAAKRSIARALSGAQVGITSPANPKPGATTIISTQPIPPSDYELIQLAEIQAMAGNVAGALKTVKSIGAQDSRLRALEQVVEARAIAGDVAKALEIALEQSKSPEERRDALQYLGRGVATRFALEPTSTPRAK